MADAARPRLSRPNRRAQLLDVARGVFAERGLAGASVEEIAERAGVSRPIIYDHFGDKDKLYRVVVDAEIEELLRRLSAAFAPERPDEPAMGRQRLERAVVGMLSYVEEHPQGFAVIARDQLTGADPSRVPELVEEIGQRASQIFARDLERIGADPAAAPIYAFGVVGMITLVGVWWSRGSKLPLEEVAGHVAALAWRGLRHLTAEPALSIAAATPRSGDGESREDRS